MNKLGQKKAGSKVIKMCEVRSKSDQMFLIFPYYVISLPIKYII